MPLNKKGCEELREEGLPTEDPSINMHRMFDYSEITEDDQDVASEIARMAREEGNEEFAQKLLKQFNMVEDPLYDMANSSFIKALEDAGYSWQVQGWSSEGGMRYPVLGIMGEIRQLNTITDKLIANVVELCNEEDKEEDD